MILVFKNNLKANQRLTKAYNYLCTPALIVHELLHYIMIKLTFTKYGHTSILLGQDYEETGNLSVAIFYIPSNKFQIFMISMAPFLALLISPALFMFDFKILSLLYIIYSILCLRVVLPSKEDFDAIKGDQKAFS